MSGTVCKFGRECRRPDCFFQHPTGRTIDESGSAPAAAATAASSTSSSRPTSASSSGNICRYGRQCHRTGCYFNHPDGRAIDDKPKQAPVAEQDDNNDAEEDEILAAIEADQNQRDGNSNGTNTANDDNFECPCCNDNPQSCGTDACLQRGMCACQFGSNKPIHITGADDQANEDVDNINNDSWRDEWCVETA